MEPAPCVLVTVAGEMSVALCAEFDDLEVTVGHGVSRIRVAGGDPSRLHGVLHRVETLGLELLDVRREPADRG